MSKAHVISTVATIRIIKFKLLTKLLIFPHRTIWYFYTVEQEKKTTFKWNLSLHLKQYKYDSSAFDYSNCATKIKYVLSTFFKYLLSTLALIENHRFIFLFYVSTNRPYLRFYKHIDNLINSFYSDLSFIVYIIPDKRDRANRWHHFDVDNSSLNLTSIANFLNRTLISF